MGEPPPGSVTTAVGGMPTASLASAMGWSVVAGAVTTLFGLLTSVVLARGLGPARMGEYSYWIWVIGTIPMFVDLGLPLATLRFAAAFRGTGQMALARSVVLALLKIQALVSAGVAAGLVFLGFASNSGAHSVLYAMVAALVLLGGAEGILGNAIKGAMDYRFATYRGLSLSALQFGLFLVVLEAGGGLTGLVMVMLGCAVVAVSMTIWRFAGVYPVVPRCVIPAETRASIASHCRSITGLGLFNVVAWSRSEVFFLGLLSSTDEIAFYSLAYGVAARLIMAATLVAHPLVPRLSALHANNEIERMQRVYQTGIRYVALLTFPLALGGMLFSGPLMSLLYGQKYLAAAHPLAVTSFSSLAAAMLFVGSATLCAIGWPNSLVWLNVGLAAVDIIAAVAFIPPYGATGAALANAIGPLATLVAVTIFLDRRYGLRFPVRETLRILLAAGGAVGLSWLLVPVGGLASFLAAVMIVGAMYVAAVLGCRLLSREEDREVLERMGGWLPVRLRSHFSRLITALR